MTHKRDPADIVVLVVDADAKIREGLVKLLDQPGFRVTAIGDEHKAHRFLEERSCGIAIVDLDTPSKGEGLSLVREIKERTPATPIIVLSARKAFEAAIRAFRAGAADVIAKTPDQVEYLRHRVSVLAREQGEAAVSQSLLQETLAVHELLLAKMMELNRQVAELEEKLSGRPSQASSRSTVVIVADPDTTLFDLLSRHLLPDRGWQLRYTQTGGAALDVASSERVDLVLCRDALLDLPGPMVVRALAKSSPDSLCIVFSNQGQAQVVEGSRAIPLEWAGEEQILEQMNTLREGYQAKMKERRSLQLFRSQNLELLRRYAELKQRLEKALK